MIYINSLFINFEKKGKLFHSITCVFCHANVESADHLLVQCPVIAHVWNYFCQLLDPSCAPKLLCDLWDKCRKNIKKPLIYLWDLLARAITWTIWIERNARIFNSICCPTVTIIVKIEHMLLLWLSVAPDSKKARLEEPMAKVKWSLEFLSSSDPTPSVPPESPPTLARCSGS